MCRRFNPGPHHRSGKIEIRLSFPAFIFLQNPSQACKVEVYRIYFWSSIILCFLIYINSCWKHQKLNPLFIGIIKLTWNKTNYERRLEMIEEIGIRRIEFLLKKDSPAADPGYYLPQFEQARSAVKKNYTMYN